MYLACLLKNVSLDQLPIQWKLWINNPDYLFLIRHDQHLFLGKPICFPLTQNDWNLLVNHTKSLLHSIFHLNQLCPKDFHILIKGYILLENYNESFIK